MLKPGMKGVRQCPKVIFTLPHFASLHIGPLDDFFGYSLAYTWVDEKEVSIHL
jgi:hypothetical protein